MGERGFLLPGLMATLGVVLLGPAQRLGGAETAGAGAAAAKTDAGDGKMSAWMKKLLPLMRDEMPPERYDCDAKKDPLCHVEQMLAEHFPPEPVDACKDKTGRALVDCLGEKSHTSTRTVIALVPDPADSSFDYTFDRELEAIRNAVADEGYLADRFHLPWKAAFASSEKSERDDDDRGVNPSHTEPGAMLFRRDGGRELLLVLLVGETPTDGVHHAALASALELVAPGKRCSEPIRVLGPTYSGTVTSLVNHLESFYTPVNDPEGVRASCSVRAVSGSATSDSNAAAFARINQLAPARADRLTWQTTVLPDGAVEAALERYLTETLGVPRERIAILGESNTFFGSWMFHLRKQRDEQQRRAPVDSFKFPMHVSQVRNALEKQRADAAASGDFPRRFLQLSLEDDRRSRDTIPPTAQLTTPSVDLQLAATLDTICKRNVQYLGIVASDVKDIIALGDAAKKSCPELRLFTYGSDLFFTHDDFAALRGMLIGATYPLYPLAPDVVGDPIHATLHFPTDISEGMYHAMHALVSDQYAPPYPSLKGHPQGAYPLVWISVVGNGGFWPLEATPAPEAARAAVLRGTAAELSKAPPPLGASVIVVALLVLGFALLHAFMFLKVQQGGGWGWFAVFDLRPTTARPSKAGYSFVALLAMFGCCAALMGPVEQYSFPVAAAIVVGWAALVVAVLVAVAPFSRRFGLLGWSLIVLPLLLGFQWKMSQSRGAGSLAELRATQLTSGVSPVMAVLLLAGQFYLLARFHLRRLRLSNWFAELERSSDSRLVQGWRERFQAVHYHAERFWFFPLPTMAAIGVGVVLPWTLLWPRVVWPFEGEATGVWLYGLFFVGYASIVFNGFRYWTTWRAYRRVLREADVEGLAFLDEKESPLRPLLSRLGSVLDPDLGLERVSAVVSELLGDGRDAERRRLAELAPGCAYANAHVNNALTYLTLSSLMLLFTSHTYPFEWDHALSTLSWLVVLSVAVVAIGVIVQMNRDAALSRFAGGRPGKLDLDGGFVSQTVMHVALPVLALVAARFPSVAGFLSGWIQPLVRVFHR
jgi:hypothetical protein